MIMRLKAPALCNISRLILVAASFGQLRRKLRWGCTLERECNAHATRLNSNYFNTVLPKIPSFDSCGEAASALADFTNKLIIRLPVDPAKKLVS